MLSPSGGWRVLGQPCLPANNCIKTTRFDSWHETFRLLGQGTRLASHTGLIHVGSDPCGTIGGMFELLNSGLFPGTEDGKEIFVV